MFDSKSDYALNKKDQDSIVYSQNCCGLGSHKPESL